MEPNPGRQADLQPTSDRADNDLPALTAITRWLRCPNCEATPLQRSRRRLECPSGHCFDIARQGYTSLLTGHRRRHAGDTAQMVAARERFLDQDHYRPLRSTITALTVEHAPADLRLVIDLAGGTGHYLAPTLRARPCSWGLSVDLSSAALRRAARSHPRAAAIAADIWQPLPLTPASAGVILSIFGPRPPAEISRVLTNDGVLVVATARPNHLRELRDVLGTIGVEQRKAERMKNAFRGFDRIAQQVVTWRMALSRSDVQALAAMGPSAHHLDPTQLGTTAEQLPDPLGVTAEMEVTVLRRTR